MIISHNRYASTYIKHLGRTKELLNINICNVNIVYSVYIETYSGLIVF